MDANFVMDTDEDKNMDLLMIESRARDVHAQENTPKLLRYLLFVLVCLLNAASLCAIFSAGVSGV